MSAIVGLLLVFASVTLIGYAVLSSGEAAWESHSRRFVARTESNLRGLFLFVDPRRIAAAYVAALVGVPLALLGLGAPPPVALAALGGVLVAPRLVLARLARRRRRAIVLALPDALGRIAAAMRAGATFTGAVQATVEEDDGPLGQELGLVLREHRLGARLEEALDDLGERVQSEEMDLVITATLIAHEVGGNLAEVLRRLAGTLRRKIEMEGKIRALTSQGVLQGRVVAALPFLVLGALAAIEPAAIGPIFSGLLGWCFLAVIVLLQLVGTALIRRIVRIDV